MSPLTAHVLATLVVTAHVTFIGFVVIGGLFALRWRRLAYLHLAGVIWAVYVEWAGVICPLTPLENTLRAEARLDAYAGDFVSEYVFPLLYPDGLTRHAQLVIGVAVLAVNGCIYAVLLRQRRSNTVAS